MTTTNTTQPRISAAPPLPQRARELFPGASRQHYARWLRAVRWLRNRAGGSHWVLDGAAVTWGHGKTNDTKTPQ